MSMETKVIKVNKLTPRDIHILTVMINNDFVYNRTYDILFPEKAVTTSNKNKSQYFRYLFEKKKEETYQFIDNYYKDKFKNSFLSRERIMTDILDLIRDAKREQDYKTVLQAYKQLADMMGLNITKSQIDISQTSVILHYHQPIVEEQNIISTNDDVVIKINAHEE